MRQHHALNYDARFSDVDSLAELQRSRSTRSFLSAVNWGTFIAVGLAVGLLAFAVQTGANWLTALKVDTSRALLDEGRTLEAFAAWLGISLAFGVVAGVLVVFVEGAAAGSGIPEVKAMLNGTNVPRFLTPTAGLVKAVGVCFSVSSGLIIGKEGPLIHIGAVTGNLACSLPKLRRFALFRSDRHKRDFVSTGAAAGVAGAFSSPVGGICFALEEAASYWRLSLTWRAFLCTMLTVTTLWALSAWMEGRDTYFGELKYGAFNREALFRIWEIPLLVVLGPIGGLAGAAFCGANARLSVWRKVHIAPSRARKLLEVLAVVAVTATTTFWMPFALRECRTTISDFQCLHSQNRYYCSTLPSDEPTSAILTPDPSRLSCAAGSRSNGTWFGVDAAESAAGVYNCTDASLYVRFTCAEGEFNTYATLSFAPLDEVIKSFFHDPAPFDQRSLACYFVLTFLLAVWTYGIQVPSGLFVPCILMGAAFGRLWGELLREAIPGYGINPGVYALVGSASMLAGVTRLTITLSVILYETTNQLYLATPIMFTILLSKAIADRFNISLYDIHIALKCLPFVEPDAPLALEAVTAEEVMNSPAVTIDAIGPASRIVATLRRTEHAGFPVVDGDGRFCGCILRNWLVVLLRRRKWTVLEAGGAGAHGEAAGAFSYAAEVDTGATDLLTPSDFDSVNSLQSKQLSVGDSDESDLPPDAILDLRPYLDAGVVTVGQSCPVARCFVLFRALGIRHLPVLNLEHRVVGMITRQELSTDFSQDLL